MAILPSKTVKKPLPTVNGRPSSTPLVRATQKPVVPTQNQSLATFKGTVAPSIPLGTKAGYVAQTLPTGKPNLTANVNLEAPVNSLKGQPASNQLVRAPEIQTSTSGLKTVYDPATGKHYSMNSAQGKALMEGMPKTVETSQAAPIATYAELGTSLANQDMRDASAVTKELFGDTATGYDTYKSYVQALGKNIDLSYKAKQADINNQAANAEQSYYDSKKQTGTAGDVMQGSLYSSGLEAPTSLSNISTAERLRDENSTRLERLRLDYDNIQTQINATRENLKIAEQQDKMDLASKYKDQLNAYELQAKQIESDHATALSQMLSAEDEHAKTQSAIVQSGIQLFQTAVDTGNEMDYNMVKSYADQLGLPADMLMGYYQGAKNIRDDKSLDLQSKQLALQQNAQDLQDQITGMNTQAAAAIRGLTTLRQQGASEEAIAAYKQAAGITDYDDPLTKAKLAFDNASAKIKQNEANGILTSPLDMIDLATKQYALWQMQGYNPSSLPEGGGTPATTAMPYGNGIRFGFDDNGGKGIKISSGSRVLSQCAQFVNDVLGLSMGDSYSSKMAYVDSNIQVPVAGMAFVMPVTGDYAPYGHTGIVESYDPSTGMVSVADVNSRGDGLARHHDIPLNQILNGGGFVPNKNGMSADQPILSTLGEKTIDNVRSEANSFRQEQIVKDYNTIANKKLTAQSIIDAGVGGAGDLALVFEFMKALDPNSVVKETEYANAAASGNIFAGAFAKFNGYFKEKGGMLPDNLKDQFKKLIDVKMSAADTQYQNLYSEYSKRINNLAGGKNVAPELITDYSKIFQEEQPKIDADTLWAKAEEEAKKNSVVQADDAADIDANW